MDNFANASFQADIVALMDIALANAVGKLPHPVSSAHVQAIAQPRWCWSTSAAA